MAVGTWIQRRARVAMAFIAMFIQLSPSLAIAKEKTETTPLIEATARGDLAAVRKLVDKGAPIDETDNEGRTALTVAIRHGNKAIVKFMLERGAAVNGYVDSNGWSPLMQAIVYAPFITAELDAKNQTTITTPMPTPPNIQNEIIELLLNHGASMEGTDRNGETVLTLATQQGRASIVKQLIKHGAAIDRQNLAGQTALMLSCRDGDQKLVGFLVQSGADISIRDNRGQTARDMFDAWRYPEISRLLEDTPVSGSMKRP